MTGKFKAILPVATIGVLALVALAFAGAVIDCHRVNSKTLERDICTGLPLGSSLSAVESFLGKRTLEFSFEPSSNMVYAIARNVKGTSVLLTNLLYCVFISTKN